MIGKTLLPLAGAALIGALVAVNAHGPVPLAPAPGVDQPLIPVAVRTVPIVPEEPSAPVAAAATAAPVPELAPVAARHAIPISHQAWIEAIKDLPPPCIAPEALPAPLRPVKGNRAKE
jgi:hypothetical protein